MNFPDKMKESELKKIPENLLFKLRKCKVN